jgi:hypothetical protein
MCYQILKHKQSENVYKIVMSLEKNMHVQRSDL